MDADTRKYLVFELLGEQLALQLGVVSEIVKARPLTPLPCAGPDMLGIFNHRGLVLPLYDLSLHIRPDSGTRIGTDRVTRYLVIGKGASAMALAAESVQEIMTIDETRIEPFRSDDRGIDTAVMRGWVSRREEDGRILIPDMERIRFMKGEHLRLGIPVRGDFSDVSSVPALETAVESLSLLSFVAGGKALAVDLTEVTEVIRLMDWEALPQGPGRPAAKTRVRDIPVYLFDLAGLLGLKRQDMPSLIQGCPFLLLPFKTATIGLLVSEVLEILEIEKDGLDLDPVMLSAFGQEFTAMVPPAEGRGLMLRLDPSVLFSALDADHLAESVRSQGLEDDRRLREVKPPGATDKYLLFTLLDEGFALPVEVVDEISLIKTLTPLPEAPDYVAGLTQIRGLVRVVVDLNKRLSMPELSLAAQDLLQQITEKLGKAGSSAVDEELSALLGERFHRKGIGHRACRLLHDYLSERSLDHAFCLEAFEQALEREIRHLEENRKLLLLSGAASCALLVDRVLTVTDVSREERLSSLKADENVQRPAWFGGSFFREELGRTFLIPDLGVLLGGTGQHGVSAPVQDTRGAP